MSCRFCPKSFRSTPSRCKRLLTSLNKHDRIWIALSSVSPNAKDVRACRNFRAAAVICRLSARFRRSSDLWAVSHIISITHVTRDSVATGSGAGLNQLMGIFNQLTSQLQGLTRIISSLTSGITRVGGEGSPFSGLTGAGSPFEQLTSTLTGLTSSLTGLTNMFRING